MYISRIYQHWHDDLATQGAGASAGMGLIYLFRNIPIFSTWRYKLIRPQR